MQRIFSLSSTMAALAVLAATTAPAIAHGGHVLDHGEGHQHVSGLLALGAAFVIAALIGAGFFAARNRRASRQASRPAARND